MSTRCCCRTRLDYLAWCLWDWYLHWVTAHMGFVVDLLVVFITLGALCEIAQLAML